MNEHFLTHWYAWPIVVIAGGWLVAVIVTVGQWIIGPYPDPDPTIEEIDDARGGKA